MTSLQVTERSNRLFDPPTVWPTAVALLGTALCLVTASLVQPEDIGDGGLAPALPPLFWAGVVAVNAAFVAGLARRTLPAWFSGLVLTCHVLVIYGTGVVATDVPRNAVAWRHVGVADAMANGHFDPRIDVYFNWPGFFAGLSTFVEASGVDPLVLATLAPLGNIAIWLVALTVIFRALGAEHRVVMVALWLFLAGNWIDQDYLSPQALGLTLHLAVLALVLTLLAAKPRGDAPVGLASLLRRDLLSPQEQSARTRQACFVLVLLLGTAAVMSHQLSPVVTILSLIALTALRRSWVPLMPAILTAIFVLWVCYPASAYLIGHPVLGADESAELIRTNLVDRVGGSPARLFVQQERMGLTAVMWLLAAVGSWRLWRQGRRDLRPMVLAVVPFLLLPAQSYGGEMLLRVTLFALPFVAYLAAHAVLLTGARAAGGSAAVRAPGWARLLVVLVALTMASVIARYGNARFDMFRPAEVAAVQQLHDLTPPGGVMVAAASSTPWASSDYADFTRRTVQGVCREDFRRWSCATEIVDLARHEAPHGITLLFTTGHGASLELQGILSAEDFAGLELALARQPGATKLFENSDARIYRLDP